MNLNLICPYKNVKQRQMHKHRRKKGCEDTEGGRPSTKREMPRTDPSLASS